MTKCGRDLETGTLVVPPKLTRAYDAEMKLQAELAAKVKVATARLKSLVAQVTNRLQNPKLLGKGDVPQLRAIPALPETLTSLPLADGQLGHLIVPLEELLQVQLGGPRPEEQAPVTAHEAAGAGAVAYEGTEAYSAEAGEQYAEGEYAQGEGETAYAEGETEDYAGEAEVAADVPTADYAPEAAEYATAESAPIGETAIAEEAGEAEITEEYAEAEQGWVIQEEGEYTEDGEEETDVVFGFEPDPTPPAPSHGQK